MRPRWIKVPKSRDDGMTSTSEEWKNLPEIPFDDMWPDDKLWMPLLLRGQTFSGRIDFCREDSEEKKGSWKMERWWFGCNNVNSD